MMQFELKAEPYRDVTDNKPNDTSPSFNNFTFASIFNFARSTIHHSSSDSTITYFDVTDNKTTDTNPSSIFKEPLTPRRIMTSENFCREDERLKTFENRWPLTFMDKNILAQTGMYYTGINDNVKCYFCEVEIGRWEITDHPVNEHMRWSPNCPLLRRRSTNNIPLDAESLDRVLPPPSYDVCGGTETIEIRPGAYAESSISSNNITMNDVTPTSPNSSNGYVYPDHPEYAIETARLRSFAEWPRTMKQKPKELSEAGFFYTGTGDRVKCFSCGGGLKDWDESDDPWEQHALWLSKCKYLKLMKGKTYIDSVIAKFKTPATQTTKQEAGNQTEDIQQQQQQQNGNSNNNNNVEKEQQEFNVKSVNCEVNATAAAAATVTAAAATTTLTALRNENYLSEAKKITDEKLCKICYADEYNTAFLPCGHVVACAKCASSVTKCPMCRKPFKDVMRVYFS